MCVCVCVFNLPCYSIKYKELYGSYIVYARPFYRDGTILPLVYTRSVFMHLYKI